MKKLGIIVLCLFITQMAYCQWDLLGKRQVGQNEVITFLKQEKKDIRKNPDGIPFVKTAYKFEVKTGEKKLKIQLKDYFYIDTGNPEMKPSIYVDDKFNMVYIFIWEKDETPGNYGMNGYVYEYDMKLKKIKKEIVFKKANCGWFPYFVKGDEDLILLRHFSYAGYWDLVSLKNQKGKWMTISIQDITPEEAKIRYLKH